MKKLLLIFISIINIYAFNVTKNISFNSELECDFVSDKALYSSYGRENQFACQKIILPITYTKNNYKLYISLAPYYNSIKYETEKPIYHHTKDDNAKDGFIDGRNVYYDWYKNLGTRIYDTNLPILEAYMQAKYKYGTIKVGRVKTFVGFDENQTPFSDDGKFSPYSYYLTKELYTGLVYSLKKYIFNANIGVFWGGSSPAKTYSRYMDSNRGAEVKLNNTPTISFKLGVDFTRYLPKDMELRSSISYEKARIGSTTPKYLYHNAQNYPKDMRGNSIFVAKRVADKQSLNITFKKKFKYLDITTMYQYLRYINGFKDNSWQTVVIQSPFYKRVTQKGYFATIIASSHGYELSYTHESFDRYDSNLYIKSKDTNYNYQTDKFKNKKLTGDLYILKKSIDKNLDVVMAYYKLKNPAEYISEIMKEQGSNKFKISLNMHF